MYIRMQIRMYSPKKTSSTGTGLRPLSVKEERWWGGGSVL